MMQIKKLTIGVQPAMKMFRLQSGWGGVLDAVFSAIGSNSLGEDFFTNVSVPPGRDQYQARNEEKGNLLTLTMDNIVFTKSFYEKDGGVNVEKFVSEFAALWAVIQKKLEVSNIRRIGMVAEHRVYEVKQPSERLMSALVTLGVQGDMGKFSLNFENRFPSGSKNAQDFINVICQIYDSALDSEFAEADAVNFNMDVQRYFAPLLMRNEVDQFSILRREFEKRWRAYQDQLSKLGLLANGK